MSKEGKENFLKRSKNLLCISEDERKRRNAYSLVRYYIRKRELKRLPCRVCGKRKVEAHIKDYNNPKGVQWLCRTHRMLALKLGNNPGRKDIPAGVLEDLKYEYRSEDIRP